MVIEGHTGLYVMSGCISSLMWVVGWVDSGSLFQAKVPVCGCLVLSNFESPPLEILEGSAFLLSPSMLSFQSDVS